MGPREGIDGHCYLERLPSPVNSLEDYFLRGSVEGRANRGGEFGCWEPSVQAQKRLAGDLLFAQPPELLGARIPQLNREVPIDDYDTGPNAG